MPKRTKKKRVQTSLQMHPMFMCRRERRFPTVSVLLLVVGVLWLLSELKYITVSVPWWPVILIILALGWLINNYSNK